MELKYRTQILALLCIFVFALALVLVLSNAEAQDVRIDNTSPISPIVSPIYMPIINKSGGVIIE